MPDGPMPWPMLVMFGLFLIYGLWPALKPDHFRQTGLKWMWPEWLKAYAAPVSQIRAFGIIWVTMAAVAVATGLYSHFVA